MRQQFRILLACLSYYTCLPTARSKEVSSLPLLAKTARYYPLVGLLLGSFTWAMHFALSHDLPFPLMPLIPLLTSLLLTGALHEDGLADTFDGLGATGNIEARLRAMKDSRLGTFGVLALVIQLGTKYILWFLLLSSDSGALLLFFLLPPLLSRGLTLGLVCCSNPVNLPNSKSAPLLSSTKDVWIGLGLCTLWSVCLLTLYAAPYAFSSVGGGIGMALLFGKWFTHRFGGYTGDTLGAVQQLSETGILMGFLIVA